MKTNLKKDDFVVDPKLLDAILDPSETEINLTMELDSNFKRYSNFLLLTQPSMVRADVYFQKFGDKVNHFQNRVPLDYNRSSVQYLVYRENQWAKYFKNEKKGEELFDHSLKSEDAYSAVQFQNQQIRIALYSNLLPRIDEVLIKADKTPILNRDVPTMPSAPLEEHGYDKCPDRQSFTNEEIRSLSFPFLNETEIVATKENLLQSTDSISKLARWLNEFELAQAMSSKADYDEKSLSDIFDSVIHSLHERETGFSPTAIHNGVLIGQQGWNDLIVEDFDPTTAEFELTGGGKRSLFAPETRFSVYHSDRINLDVESISNIQPYEFEVRDNGFDDDDYLYTTVASVNEDGGGTLHTEHVSGEKRIITSYSEGSVKEEYIMPWVIKQHNYDWTGFRDIQDAIHDHYNELTFNAEGTAVTSHNDNAEDQWASAVANLEAKPFREDETDTIFFRLSSTREYGQTYPGITSSIYIPANDCVYKFDKNGQFTIMRREAFQEYAETVRDLIIANFMRFSDVEDDMLPEQFTALESDFRGYFDKQPLAPENPEGAYDFEEFIFEHSIGSVYYNTNANNALCYQSKRDSYTDFIKSRHSYIVNALFGKEFMYHTLYYIKSPYPLNTMNESTLENLTPEDLDYNAYYRYISRFDNDENAGGPFVLKDYMKPLHDLKHLDGNNDLWLKTIIDSEVRNITDSDLPRYMKVRSYLRDQLDTLDYSPYLEDGYNAVDYGLSVNPKGKEIFSYYGDDSTESWYLKMESLFESVGDERKRTTILLLLVFLMFLLGGEEDDSSNHKEVNN